MHENLYRWVLVAVAAVVVVAGGLYLFLGGNGDEAPVDDGGDLPFGGTPLPDLPGVPTAVAGTGPIGPERPEIGNPAPDFALLGVRDGETLFKLSDFAGNPVVLNWYATWCGPCKEELPLYQDASVALEGEVTFFAVNLLEPRDRAEGLLEELGITFPAVLDPNGAVSDRWRVTNMPVTFFINGEGVLVAQRIGQVTETELQTRLAEMGVTYAP